MSKQEKRNRYIKKLLENIEINANKKPILKEIESHSDNARKISSSNNSGRKSADKDARIVGGRDAQIGSWPWQVLITSNQQQYVCGGSIVTSVWTLSAAHCFIGSKPSSVRIFAGLHDLENPTSDLKIFFVDRIVPHPNCSSSLSLYDAALLKSRTEIVFDKVIQPVFLQPVQLPDKIVKDSICTATGWGRLRSNGPLATTLQQVAVPLVNHKSCAKRYGHGVINRKSHICAGNLNRGGVDACQGDSGGPLVCLRSPGTWYQVGVVSFGAGCADKDFPGVYTRVSSVYEWVNGVTGGRFNRVSFCDASEETGAGFGELYFKKIDTGGLVCYREIKTMKVRIIKLEVFSVNGSRCFKNILLIQEKENKSEIDLCKNFYTVFVSKTNSLKLKLNVLTDPFEVLVKWNSISNKVSSAVLVNKKPFLYHVFFTINLFYFYSIL